MGRPLTGCSLWQDTAGRASPPVPRSPATRRLRRRRGRRRASPGCGPPTTCSRPTPPCGSSSLEAETRRLRRLGTQRRLVLGAVPGRPSTAWPRCPASSRERGGRPARAMRGHRRRGAAASPTAEGIDARTTKGGTITLARTPVQLAPGPRRGRGRPRLGPRPGPAPPARPRTRPRAVCSRLAASLGATYTPDCAAVHPLRLVRGLARAVERRGGTIHEHTRVREHRARRAWSPTTARSGPTYVVRATEGYTPGLAGARRAVVPVYSLVVATEPLSDEQWDRDRPPRAGRRSASTATWSSTASAPPTAGSSSAAAARRTTSGRRSAPRFDRDERRLGRDLRATLRRPVPRARRRRPRRVHPRVGRPARASPATGAPRSGSTAAPVSPGPAATSATASARRTWPAGPCATSSSGRSTELTALPWVQHRSRRWEPEPLRWLGINAGLRAMTLADHEERAHRPARAGSPAAMAAPASAATDAGVRPAVSPERSGGPRSASSTADVLDRGRQRRRPCRRRSRASSCAGSSPSASSAGRRRR